MRGLWGLYCRLARLVVVRGFIWWLWLWQSRVTEGDAPLLPFC